MGPQNPMYGMQGLFKGGASGGMAGQAGMAGLEGTSAGGLFSKLGPLGVAATGVGALAGLQESSKQKSLQPLASNLLLTALLFS